MKDNIARPFVNTWTSSELAKSERYDAWAGVLNEAYGRWEMARPTAPDFCGAVKHYNDAVLRVIECACDPCAATRNRSCIRADGLENLTVQVVLQGRERIRFDGEDIALKQGDLLIWDSTRPMSFQVQERLHKISVVLPLPRFQSWLSRSRPSVRHWLDGRSNSGLLLHEHVKALSASVFAGGCRDSHALVDATIGVLLNALGPGDAEGPKPLRVIQLRHVKDYIHANLRSPGLSPAVIARAGGMSSRYLHWLFRAAAAGTVSQYILRRRMDFCARDLSNPSMRHRKISDIAFYWGFQDLAHFNKRFKQRYEVSPGAFREKMIRGDGETNGGRRTTPAKPGR